MLLQSLGITVALMMAAIALDFPSMIARADARSGTFQKLTSAQGTILEVGRLGQADPTQANPRFCALCLNPVGSLGHLE